MLQNNKDAPLHDEQRNEHKQIEVNIIDSALSIFERSCLVRCVSMSRGATARRRRLIY